MPRKCYEKSINFDSSYKVGTLLRDRIQMLVVTIFIFSSLLLDGILMLVTAILIFCR